MFDDKTINHRRVVSLESMFIQPLAIVVTSKKEKTQSDSYFLSKVLSIEDFVPLEIDKQTIEQVQQLVARSEAQVTENVLSVVKDRELAKLLLPVPDDLKQQVRRRLSKFGTSNLYYAYGRAIVLEGPSNSVFIMANSSSDTEHVANQISNEISRLVKVTTDFGLAANVIADGKDFGNRVTRAAKNVVGTKTMAVNNDFEREMIAEMDAIYSAALPNIEISFTSPRETFEYDILLPIAPGVIIDIETKDYSRVRDELHADSTTLKSNVILSPLDKARRLGADPVIVANGFPSDTFAQMQEFATSRNITLLDRPSSKPEIVRLLIAKMLTSAKGRFTRFIEPEFLMDWNVTWSDMIS